MAESLWGAEFEIEDTPQQVKKIVSKIAKPKKIDWSLPAEKLIKSKNTTIEQKLQIIDTNTLRILGVYKDNTLVIRSKDQLVEYIDRAIENDALAIDTETNMSLDPLTCTLMGPCIYTPGMKQAYIPLNHVNYQTGERLSNQLTEQDIKEQFDRLNQAKTKVFTHNGTFDFEVLKCTTGYEMEIYWDTFIGSMLLDENEKSHGLKQQYISKIDPSIEKYSIDHLFGAVPYEYIDPDIFALYAATDAYMTYKLYLYQKEQFEQPGMERLYKLFQEVEIPLMRVVAQIELTGVEIDQEYAKRLGYKYHQISDNIETRIAEELKKYDDKIAEWRKTPEANYHPTTQRKNPKTGLKEDAPGKSKNELLEDPVSLKSPIQLAILLYDVLKVPPVNKEKPRGTGEDELKAIDLPLCKLMLEKRGLDKLIEVFIDKLPASVSEVDHRLHAHFNQLGTKCITGDTIIPTPEGYRTVQDIVESQTQEIEDVQPAQVALINRYQNIESCDGVVKYLQRPIKVITLESGIQIKGTYDHPVIALRHNIQSIAQEHQRKDFDLWAGADFRRLEDLRVGDYVEIPLGWNRDSGKILPTNWSRRQLKTHNSVERAVPQYYDEDVAELFGIYHADGTCVDGSNGSCRIGIHNKDLGVRREVKRLAKKLFDHDCGEWISSHKDNEVDTYVNINHINELRNQLPKGAHNKKIPGWLYQSSTGVINAYIRGLTLDSLLHADHYGGGRYKIHVMKEQDARFIQQHLFSLGIESSIWSLKGKTASGGWCIQLGAYATKLFIEKIGWIADKHTSRISEVLTWKGKPHRAQKDNVTIRQVISISEDVADVYDVCMPATHSFLGGCVINHNTGRFSSTEPNL